MNNEHKNTTDPGFTLYYQECFRRLEDPRAQQFLDQHGISMDTAEAYLIGFDPEADPANAPGALEGDNAEKKHPCPRLIVPSLSSWDNYTGIRIDGETMFYKVSARGSKAGIWGTDNLNQDAQEVFVVQEVIEALSVTEAGGRAVALNTAANVDILLAELKKKLTRPALIICESKDPKQQRALDLLAAGLQKMDADYLIDDLCCGEESLNAALVNNREAFTEAVRASAAAVREGAEAVREEYLNDTAAAHVEQFKAAIKEKATRPAISTGFSSLDDLLDGGLYDGLYIMGALSSLGKTTFALQIMDNIAKAGRDCLIFSLEMAESELWAKSVSRNTYLFCNGNQRNAKTTRGIMAGHKYKDYSQAERDLIEKASDAYKEYGDHLRIIEGVGNIGIARIKAEVERHIKMTGHAPVVLIDYLQLLAPVDPHFSDKQNTDRAVLELKRMSRDHKTPVIAISSFNRDNYTAPVNMAAFKESGAIEYSSDVLIGLQYEGMDYREGETDKQREKRIRDLFKDMEQAAKDLRPQHIQVKVLKNRNGVRGSLSFDFLPAFNYFTDGQGFEPMREADMPSAWK
jgi:replicative DNA helicase